MEFRNNGQQERDSVSRERERERESTYSSDVDVSNCMVIPCIGFKVSHVPVLLGVTIHERDVP